MRYKYIYIYSVISYLTTSRCVNLFTIFGSLLVALLALDVFLLYSFVCQINQCHQNVSNDTNDDDDDGKRRTKECRWRMRKRRANTHSKKKNDNVNVNIDIHIKLDSSFCCVISHIFIFALQLVRLMLPFLLKEEWTSDRRRKISVENVGLFSWRWSRRVSSIEMPQKDPKINGSVWCILSIVHYCQISLK